MPYRGLINIVSAGLVLTAPLAYGHGGHDPRLKISVSDTEIRIETSLNVETFLDFDTNKDGGVSVSEYETQYDAIAAWIDARLQLMDDEQKTLRPYFADAPIVDRGHLSQEDAVDNIKILRRYKFDKNTHALNLTLSLYNHSPQLLYSRAGSFETLLTFELCLLNLTNNKKSLCRTSF